MAERLLHLAPTLHGPPEVPESLISSQNTTLGSHKSACSSVSQSRSVTSLLILLLTDKAHPVYSGGQGRLHAQLGKTTKTGFMEKKKPCICVQKPFCNRFPHSLVPLQSYSDVPMLLQPQHSMRDATERGKGVKLYSGETCTGPQTETTPGTPFSSQTALLRLQGSVYRAMCSCLHHPGVTRDIHQ